MDTTDTESVEDESEQPQQPYVDIEAVNNTLTEVHQQYNNLLLKYSNALNIIDELKCQLACGVVNKEIAGGWSESNALELRKDVRYLEADITREPLPLAPSKRNSNFVTLRHSGDRINRERAILCASDVGSLPPLEHGQVGLHSPTGVPTFPPENNLREARHIEADCELEALEEPASSCMSVILDPTNDFVSYTAPTSMDDAPKFSSHPCAYDSTRRRSSSHKTASVQRKYHQVAVVYPAQRNAELCTVGCCLAHSCCCCTEQKKSRHRQMDAPHSSCCFNAGLDATFTHLSRKCLWPSSGTSATADTSLFKISSALDIALKLAAELRKNSSSLLQQL
ncbi:uncharacterized protein LOC142585151 [Dermacentor variabilis]|uniref:uncharacterized protein LOC142585151 n=1 Tax=Dermacentor variabilis TaxID=34621 RepID=UPI003F5B73ED